ncbi:MAG: FecR family protein [Saprospiraceae bacterium]
MNKFDHITSIHRQISGQITVAEQQQLNQWLAESSENEVIAKEVELIWHTANTYRNTTTTNVEGALKRFKKARAAEETRIESTPTPVKSLPLRRYFLRIAVAAGFLFGLFFLLPEMLDNSSDGFTAINTDFNQIEETALADGSTIYVNESTSFEYPTTFDANFRAVKLEGEAFFDVARDEDRPFSIATNQLDVKVLGTSFNVYAYPNKKTEEVAVATGKVAVTVKETQKEYILTAGEHLSYDAKTKEATISKDKKQNAQAWRTGVLTFESTPLATVFQTLEKHFDISIDIENKELLNCTVTVPAFKNASQEVVLETLQTLFNMKLEYKGKGVLFSEGACN